MRKARNGNFSNFDLLCNKKNVASNNNESKKNGIKRGAQHMYVMKPKKNERTNCDIHCMENLLRSVVPVFAGSS